MFEWNGLLTGVAGVVSGWVAAHIGRKAKHDELKASPYIVLADRVIALEQRVGHLEEDRIHDRVWIARTITRVVKHDDALTPLLLPWPLWWEDKGFADAVLDAIDQAGTGECPEND